MNRKIYSGLAVTLFLVAMGVSAAEHRGHDGSGPRGFGDPERMVEAMVRHLELDDNQAQTVRNIVTAGKPEIDELRSRARANRDAIAALQTSDPDYSARLQNLAEENGYLASQATQLHGRLRAEINAELTPEQQQQLADKAGRMKHRSGRQHRHKDREAETQ
jgi:Spy/CpxP family protein refolding chaperone